MATRSGHLALWYTTAFVAGAVTMALEMVAFRLYAPYLGYSIAVWGTLIAVVLGAMALGYALGGVLADRREDDRLLFTAILAGAVYQLLMLFAAHPLLASLEGWGEFSGTLAATLAVFAPPMLLLAGVGPFVIRLAARRGHVGATVGWVYALSTIGSILGVLGTSFLLLPGWGTRATLQVLCGATTLLGVAGLLRHRGLAVLGLLLLALLPLAPRRVLPDGTLWAGESVYNVVHVVESEGRRGLVLNQHSSPRATERPSHGWTAQHRDDFAVGPLLVDAHRMLVLGMGTGASLRSVRSVAPEVEIDAVELDPLVVQVATEFFGLDAEAPGLSVHVADARRFVNRASNVYELVQVDLFHGGSTMPFYLATVEFFERIRARLSDDGLVMMSVFDAAPGHALLDALAATLSRVFSTLLVASRDDAHHLILAFAEHRDLASVRESLRRHSQHAAAGPIAADVAERLRELLPSPNAVVLTDDRSPVEALTREMLQDYRRSQAAWGVR